MELDTLTDKAVLVKVEDNLEAVRKRQRTPRKQYLDVIKDATDTKAVFDEIIKQLVTIKLQDLLGQSGQGREQSRHMLQRRQSY
jgi:hypothetical protein